LVIDLKLAIDFYFFFISFPLFFSHPLYLLLILTLTVKESSMDSYVLDKKRLIVVVPGQLANNVYLATRIHNIADQLDADVMYLALAVNPDHMLELSHRMETMRAITKGTWGIIVANIVDIPNYIIIVGCGELGSQLASTLLKQRKSITIIDKDEDAFKRLPDQFSGFTIEGNGIEEDTLVEAGINRANMLVAVTGDDNVNIMIAQIARVMYHVPSVIARLCEPSRARLIEDLNIKTICPTDLSVRAFSLLLPDQAIKGRSAMKIIIVGGGMKVHFLAKSFISKGYDITIINDDIEYCKKLSRTHRANVVNGDGSLPEILEDAGIEYTDAVIASTPDDPTNLVICQLASKLYEVPKTIIDRK
jgi:trk system potassium uptake protein